MQSNDPLFSDRSKISIIQMITPVLIIYLLFLGLTTGDALTLFLSALLVLYFVFTFHFRYEIFRDAVVIRYLGPRRMVVPLADIADVQTIGVPLRGETVVIRRHNRGPLLLRPNNPGTFLERLDQLRT